MNFLQLTPAYHTRIWGGQNLKARQPPIGEAWLIYEANRVATGPWAGRTLAEVTAERGAAWLGQRAAAVAGGRFPLLIKLLDCADWLSVQVHPNDEQALHWEGAGQFGKTEAWHILRAEPGARLIAGVKPGTTAETLAHAIRGGATILDHVQYHVAQNGDTIHMPAGTLHALGPGLLLYEVQQTSDITYRVYDWDRPAQAGRALHIEQSVAVTDPRAPGQVAPLPALTAPVVQPLVTCPYFVLELIVHTAPLALSTTSASCHALTVIEGQVEVIKDAERVTLQRFESVIIAADAGDYQLAGTARVLRARVE